MLVKLQGLELAPCEANLISSLLKTLKQTASHALEHQ
jgi:hypothetical protein